MNDVKERWVVTRDDERYEVSNFGRVRNKMTGKILKQHPNRKEDGYLRVALGGRKEYVHRVVAKSFYGGEDEDAIDYDKCQVNHKDGNRYNNNLTNLEWCTPSENIKHAFINWLKYPMTLTVVRCKFCKNRGEFDICEGQDDSFYCAYGER